jgi:hypothetical protein
MHGGDAGAGGDPRDPRGGMNRPLHGAPDSAPMPSLQHAADLMSPVGQQYPEHVDWTAMASGRARAVPPWLLAVLFIGAIGIALAITVVVARLIH